MLDALEREQRVTGQRIHARDELRQLLFDDEILALVHERLNRRRGALGQPSRHLTPAFAGEIGILLRTERANSFLMIRLVRMNHE